MEEKKAIKINFSTFFLIITIIAIGIMGFFIYKLNYDKTKATAQVNELSNRVSLLESTKKEPTIIEKTNTNAEITKNNSDSVEDNTKSAYSYDNIKGLYKYNKKLNADSTAQYELCLLDNGTFSYHYMTEFDHALWGNYIIVNDEIILNQLFTTESDVGIHAIEEGKIKLKINSDGTITDTNELLNVEAKYKKLFKEIKLEKSSNKDDIDVLNNTSINKQIKSTLSMFSN